MRQGPAAAHAAGLAVGLCGAAGLADIDANGLTKIDDLSFSIKLKRANAIIDRELAQYTNSIIPIGYDVKNPVGTGPFRFGSFTPGDRTHMPAYSGYWRTGLPYVAELVIIDFPDDTARINALMGGQVHVIDNVPFAQTVPLGMTPGLKTLDDAFEIRRPAPLISIKP